VLGYIQQPNYLFNLVSVVIALAAVRVAVVAMLAVVDVELVAETDDEEGEMRDAEMVVVVVGEYL
jgi:hypothetical protein